MDLFRMPVELKIDTDGKTETKRIEVAGTNSAYAVETFGKPRKHHHRSQQPRAEELAGTASADVDHARASRTSSRAT